MVQCPYNLNTNPLHFQIEKRMELQRNKVSFEAVKNCKKLGDFCSSDDDEEK